MNTPPAALILVVLTVFSGNYGNLGNNFGAAEPQNVTFHMVKNVEGFNGYIAPSDYIKETRLTGNDRIKCAAECVLITDCLSFFLDTNKSVCQFHSTIIGTTSWLTSSPSSLYFKVATGCPESWYSFGESCYSIEINTKLTFDNAKNHCTQMGGYVVRIDSADENNYIKGVISSISSSTGYWIGLVDVSQSNTWLWEETGQVPTFTDWDNGQPQANTEYCTFFYPSFLKWHDVNCGSSLNTICEVQ